MSPSPRRGVSQPSKEDANNAKYNPSEPRPYRRRGKRQPGRWEIDLRGVLDNGLVVERERRVFPLSPSAGKIGKRQAAAMALEEFQRWNQHGQVLRPGERPPLPRTGAMTSAAAPTVAQFLPDYLEFCASPNAGPRGANSPATLYSKETIFRVHLLPVFGAMRLDQIHRRDVDRYIIDKTKSGRGEKSVQMDVKYLRHLLYVAKTYEVITQVPDFKVPGAPPGDVDALDPDEAERFSETYKAKCGTRDIALLGLYLRAGLRCGEALGLYPSDFDLDGPSGAGLRPWSVRAAEGAQVSGHPAHVWSRRDCRCAAARARAVAAIEHTASLQPEV